MIRVLILDDFPILRLGLKTLLNRADIEVHESDLNSGVQTLKAIQPDVVILKLNIELIESIKQESDNIKIVVIGQQHIDDGLLKLVFNAGATSYLLQDTKPDIFLYAVEMSYQGQCWVDPRVSRVILDINKEEDNSFRKGKKFGESLTSMEMKVLRLMAEGFSNEQIAVELHLSTGSIRGYTNSLNLKLGSMNRAHAVFRAISLGYISCNQQVKSSHEIFQPVY